MASSSTSIFTGTSHFSSDFQNVIDRRLAIASLPLHQMQSQVQTLQSESTELNALTNSFSSVTSALSGLDSALGLGSYSSSVADDNVVSASLSGTPLPGKFTIQVVSMGAYASSMSADGLNTVTDASASNFSDATSFTLKEGGETHTITPTGSTLQSLAEAINLADAHVQATIVNIGSAGSPDYRLSLDGTKLGDLPIELKAVDGSNPGQVLSAAQNVGSAAQYRVNGKPAIAVSSDTRTLTVSPGLNVTLLEEGATEVTVTRGTGALSAALARFASAYNAAQSAIDHNRGKAAGALHGQSILSTLTGGLHQISQYSSGSGGINSLAALGLTFDKEGVLSFDAAAFSTAADGKVAQLSEFLGSKTGGGFLKFATEAINILSGEDSGVLTQVTASVKHQIDAGNDSIAKEQDRISQLQTQIEAKMSAADAAIAAMEQQYTFISNMFTAMRSNDK